MSLDGILINKISNNINDCLPMHINKISSFSNTEICINVHSNNKRTNLIISMHPEDCHIRICKNPPMLPTVDRSANTYATQNGISHIF